MRARSASYELAGRMQVAAKEALDISSEPKHVLSLYGVDNPLTADYGRRCLVARRLIERGVRYVQVLNNGQSWDHHGGLIKALPERCAETDQPSAALVLDLEQYERLGQGLPPGLPAGAPEPVAKPGRALPAPKTPGDGGNQPPKSKPNRKNRSTP